MKQYLLSMYQPEGPPPPSAVLEPVMRNINGLIAEAKATGVWVFNGGLHPPSTATVVQSRDGEMMVTDGPFVEGKEHIGGFFVIKAADLDSALDWARKLARILTLPGVPGGLPIEVRPFQGEVEN